MNLETTTVPRFLEGSLLVATYAIQDSCFTRSVIFMCTHNAEGAMGIIINHTIDNISTAKVLEQLDIKPATDARFPIYFGGPVETMRGFALHTTDYHLSDTVVFPGGNFAITSNSQVIKDYMENKGPSGMILALGYAGWRPGQLESEIASNSWITVPASASLVFGTKDNEKWEAAAKSLGIDISKLSLDSGTA